MSDLFSFSQTTVVGRVGQAPEIRKLPNGNSVANFSVATSESWKDKTSGERKEDTEWHRVTVWNEHYIKMLEKMVRKGDRIMVIGANKTRKWEDKDGKSAYATDIVVKGYSGGIVILESKRSGEASASSSSGNDAGPGARGGGVEYGDDIPF